MRIAVCGCPLNEMNQFCSWLRQGMEQAKANPEIVPFCRMEDFWSRMEPGYYQTVILGAGGSEGFLAARRLRAMDRHCSIIMLDDSDRNSIACLRLHTLDYVIRPYDGARIAQCAQRVLNAQYGADRCR